MKRLLTLLGLVLVATLLVPVAPASAGGCVPTPRDTDPYKSSPYRYKHSRVWLYGDSITYQTWRNLATTLPSIAVDTWWGKNTVWSVSELRDDVRAYPNRLPDVVVMATGTNDQVDPETFARQVQRARKIVPDRIPILWINVYTEYVGSDNATINAIIDAAAGVKVARWDRVNRRVVEGSTSPLLVDGIHVNSAGCTARNTLIHQRIKDVLANSGRKGR